MQCHLLSCNIQDRIWFVYSKRTFSDNFSITIFSPIGCCFSRCHPYRHCIKPNTDLFQTSSHPLLLFYFVHVNEFVKWYQWLTSHIRYNWMENSKWPLFSALLKLQKKQETMARSSAHQRYRSVRIFTDSTLVVKSIHYKFLGAVATFSSIIFITIVSYTFLYFSMRSTDNWILLPMESKYRTLRSFIVLCWSLWFIVHGGELQWSDAKWWLAAFFCRWSRKNARIPTIFT